MLDSNYQADCNALRSPASVLNFQKSDKLISNVGFEPKDIMNVNQINSLLLWCNTVTAGRERAVTGCAKTKRKKTEEWFFLLLPKY